MHEAKLARFPPLLVHSSSRLSLLSPRTTTETLKHEGAEISIVLDSEPRR